MDGAFKDTVFDSVAWKAFSQLRRQPRSLTALTSLTPSSRIPSSPPEHVTSISLLPIRRVPYFPTDPPRCFEGHCKILKHIWGKHELKCVQKCWNTNVTYVAGMHQHLNSIKALCIDCHISSITALCSIIELLSLLKSDNFRCSSLQLGRCKKEDMRQLLPSHSQRGVESEINNSNLEQSTAEHLEAEISTKFSRPSLPEP